MKLTTSVRDNGLVPARQPVSRERSEEPSLSKAADRGRFHRRFTLPDTVDTDDVSVTGRNGVLEISIAKRAWKAARPSRAVVCTQVMAEGLRPRTPQT